MSRSLVLLVLRDTVRRPPFRPPVSPRMSSESMVEASRALVAVLGGDLCRADLFLHLQRVLLVLGPAGVRVLGSGLTRVSDLVHLADALPEPAAERDAQEPPPAVLLLHGELQVVIELLRQYLHQARRLLEERTGVVQELVQFVHRGDVDVGHRVGPTAELALATPVHGRARLADRRGRRGDRRGWCGGLACGGLTRCGGLLDGCGHDPFSSRVSSRIRLIALLIVLGRMSSPANLSRMSSSVSPGLSSSAVVTRPVTLVPVLVPLGRDGVTKRTGWMSPSGWGTSSTMTRSARYPRHGGDGTSSVSGGSVPTGAVHRPAVGRGRSMSACAFRRSMSPYVMVFCSLLR